MHHAHGGAVASSSSSCSSPSRQMFTSSSCISLYETIDEVEPLHTVHTSASPHSDTSAGGDPKSLPPPLPPSNATKLATCSSAASVSSSSYAKFRGGAGQSSRQLRLHSSAMHDSDWKRNRRSSAIIFGSDFSDLIVDEPDEGCSTEEPTSITSTSVQPLGVSSHSSSSGSTNPSNHSVSNRQSNGGRFGQHQLKNGSMGNGHHGHHQAHNYPSIHSSHSFLHHHHSMNRSSDDLLLMANRSQNYQANQLQTPDHSSASDQVRSYTTAVANGLRIYENLNGPHQPHHHHQQQQHSHKRSDNHHHNRKLTKDSGYESASTLVSLTQLNSLSSLQPQVIPQQSSPQPQSLVMLSSLVQPLPPPASAALNLNSSMISHQNGIGGGISSTLHSRSDSIDSANSLDHHLQSPSPPVPKWYVLCTIYML